MFSLGSVIIDLALPSLPHIKYNNNNNNKQYSVYQRCNLVTSIDPDDPLPIDPDDDLDVTQIKYFKTIV